MDEKISSRIGRLYNAIGQAIDPDVQKYRPTYFRNEKVFGVVQEFSGGASEEELSNTLHSLVHNIASFHDHLCKWGPSHSVNRDGIHGFFKASLDFCVIRDLWNNDKHGYPPRDNGWSGKAPHVRDIHRALQLGGGPGTTAWMQLTPGGPVYGGTGTHEATICGDVIDADGNKLGDVSKFVRGAITRCEEALKQFGVVQPAGEPATAPQP